MTFKSVPEEAIHTGLDTYFVEAIVNPNEKVRSLPKSEIPITESPPTLDELIRKLEVEHFGQGRYLLDKLGCHETVPYLGDFG